MVVRVEAVTTTADKIVDTNEDRTAILIANPDASTTVYISDASGLTTSTGFPVFPETYVLLSIDEGVEIEKPLYAIVASGTVNIRIWEHLRAWPPGNGGGKPPVDPVIT